MTSHWDWHRSTNDVSVDVDVPHAVRANIINTILNQIILSSTPLELFELVARFKTSHLGAIGTAPPAHSVTISSAD